MECKNIYDVRSNIDRIDNQIIKLIAERGSFVKQDAKFKKIVKTSKHPKG